jgi:thiol-disulfide isomerase/thioredoxin
MERVRNAFSAIRARLSWKLFFIFVTIILLIIAIVYVYKKYLVPKLNPTYVPNKEFIEKSDDPKDAEVLMFTVDWCPYCKKAAPVWKDLKKEYDGRNISGYTLHFETINCTDEKNAEVKAMQNKYNIDGYPTIKLLKDGEVITYDAKPERKTFEQFLDSVLKN